MQPMNKEPQQYELKIAGPAPTPPKADEREGWTSASNARADALCPGRHLAQVGMPELPKLNDDSDTGVVIHDALYRRDPAKLKEGHRQTYDLCLEVEDRVVKQFFGSEAADLMTIAEQRYWFKLGAKNARPLKHSGKCDRIYRSKTKALVVEYKTLPGDVPSAASNEQLRDQVVLVKGNLLPNIVGCVVIQPLVTTKPEICIYNAEQLKQAERLMIDRIRASNDSESPRNAGEVQCAFCRAKYNCHAYQRFAAQSVPTMTDFIDSPVATWTPEQCLVFLQRWKVAETWLNETKEAVRKRVEAKEIPGWTIGRGDRKFVLTDIKSLRDRCVALGITPEEFLAICSPSKEDLQALIRAKTGAKGKGLTSEVEKVLAGIVADERKRGSLERNTP